MPSQSPILRIENAVKRYGRVVALDGLSLDLQAGEWLGLLGPNGAGKTTAMLAVAGLVSLDGGRIELDGRPTQGPVPADIGLVPQEVALYHRLTAKENLAAFGRLNGLTGALLEERVRWALDWTGLEARADERVGGYSGGMKRRLNIACGVLHRPRVVLLDEPTVGVDPQARERIFDMLDELTAAGSAVVQSTHELGDIEGFCDRLVVMDYGREVATGTLEDLIRDGVGDHAQLTLELDREPPDGMVPDLEIVGRRITGRLDEPARELPRLMESIGSAGCQIVRLEVRPPGLAEVFVALTGRELRE